MLNLKNIHRYGYDKNSFADCAQGLLGILSVYSESYTAIQFI